MSQPFWTVTLYFCPSRPGYTSPTWIAPNMPKKRVQSSTADPEATVVAAASSSTEPVKEPTPPLQVSYCGSQSILCNLISEIVIDALFSPLSLYFPP